MGDQSVSDYIRNMFLKKQGDPSDPSNFVASLIPSSMDDSAPTPLAPSNPVRAMVSNAIANKTAAPARAPSVLPVDRAPAVVPDSTAVVEDDDKPSVAPGSDNTGFDSTMDTDALRNAQAHAKSQTKKANLGEAADQIAYSLVRSDVPDNSFYENMKKDAQQPIKNIQALRQSTVQDQGQKAAAANADPNSDVSKGLQNLYASKFGMSADMLSKLSADQIKQFQSPAELAAKLQEMKEAATTRAEAIKEAAKDRYAFQLANQGQKAGTKNDAANMKDEEGFKSSLDKNESYKEANNAYSSADALMKTVQAAITNPTSAQSLPTELGNFASRGKRLHTATVDAFMHPDSGLMSRISQAVTKSKQGTITPEIANEITQYLQSEKSSAADQKNAVLQSEGESFNKIHGRYPKLYTPGGQPGPASSPASTSYGNRIPIKSPKDGTVRMIPPEQVDEAIAAGGKRVS